MGAAACSEAAVVLVFEARGRWAGRSRVLGLTASFVGAAAESFRTALSLDLPIWMSSFVMARVTLLTSLKAARLVPLAFIAAILTKVDSAGVDLLRWWIVFDAGSCCCAFSSRIRRLRKGRWGWRICVSDSKRQSYAMVKREISVGAQKKAVTAGEWGASIPLHPL